METTMNYVMNFLTQGGPIFTAITVILILIIGRFIAKLVSKMITKALKSTGMDEKLNLKDFSLAEFLSKLVYYLLMIIVLMVALEILGVKEVLEPLRDMTKKVFSYIPNIIVAFLIGYIGYFLAKVASEAVNLVGDSLLKLAPKFNLPENIDVVDIAKKVVFVFIFIPILLIAVNTLNIEIITRPSTIMLSKFSAAIPNIIAAIIILLVAVVLGKLISGLLKGLLEALQLDSITEKLGLKKVLGNTNLPTLLSKVVYFLIIYFALIEAFNQLGFVSFVDIMNELLAVFGKILFGLVILVVGNFVANLVGDFYNKGANNKFLGAILKGVVLVIFLTMGLYSMGIAKNIVELAFGLALGALAVAFALAFGLGGREAAGEEMKNFFKRLRENK
ncbi:MAG: mechanosensitive ion channel [Flavobacteriaceae bacterium]|nr:mechanosensitive ion channel [Flavobacteriaceae bacterium]